MTPDNSLPPHNPDVEAAVIEILLAYQDQIAVARDILQPGDFYLANYRAAYEAIVELWESGVYLDVFAVADKMPGEPHENLLQLTSLTHGLPYSVYVENHARTVAELSARRRALRLAGKLADVAWDVDNEFSNEMTGLQKQVLEITAGSDGGGLRSARDVGADYLDRFEEKLEAKADGSLIPTPFYDLNHIIGGFSRSELVMFAARPKMGKTSWMLSCLRHIAITLGKRVALFSLEMSEEQVINRLVAMHTRIPLNRPDAPSIKKPWLLNEEQVGAVYAAVGAVSESGLYVDQTAMIDTSRIRARTMRMAAGGGVDMVVVDHMHIMGAAGTFQNKVDKYGDITMELSALAKDLDIPVLVLAQLSRSVEQRQNKRPMLSDIRESGQIEEGANMIMFLYRDDYYDADSARGPIAEVNVAAYRDGETGTADLLWDAELTQFKNLARTEIELPKVKL